MWPLGDETGEMLREADRHSADYRWRIVEPRVGAGVLLGLDQSTGIIHPVLPKLVN